MVKVAMSSWRMSDRWMQIDFHRHELLVLEEPWVRYRDGNQVVTIDANNFRQVWAKHLMERNAATSMKEALELVAVLEARDIRNCPEQ